MNSQRSCQLRGREAAVFSNFYRSYSLLEYDTRVVDVHFSLCNELMMFMVYVHAQAFEFANESLDLFFHRIPTHVSQVFVRLSTQDFVNGSSQSISNCDFGFVCRAEARLEFPIFGSIV